MIKLNLARNCLRYLIRAYDIKEIFIPYYSCNTIWRAVRKEGCEIKFYHIGQDFLPLKEFGEKDFVLYINYFGLCDDNCKKLEKIYPNLIVDNTHAFYSEPFGLASFNSLRKFFPVQNGAYLYTNKVLGENFVEDKFLFNPVLMGENYEEFVRNEKFLDNENIKYIYPKVEEFMEKFDFEQDKKSRIERFLRLDKLYNKYNNIKLSPTKKEVPYCYPLSTEDKDIQKELSASVVPLLALWGEIPKDFPEYEFLNNVVAL